MDKPAKRLAADPDARGLSAVPSVSPEEREPATRSLDELLRGMGWSACIRVDFPGDEPVKLHPTLPQRLVDDWAERQLSLVTTDRAAVITFKARTLDGSKTPEATPDLDEARAVTEAIVKALAFPRCDVSLRVQHGQETMTNAIEEFGWDFEGEYPIQPAQISLVQSI